MTARLHRGGAANVARRADQIERRVLDKAKAQLRAGRPSTALTLLEIAAKSIERAQS